MLSEEIIGSFSEKVRATSFHDARNTSNDPVLLGPPSVEFAPYARVPGSRSRKDGRQGTIDQDPEFVTFLESLTNPIVKPTPAEGEAEKKEEEEITITPLVQFIKEKKASKAKDSASGKSSKRSGAKEKEIKAEKVESKKLLKRPDREAAAGSTPASLEKKPAIAKVEKATKEAVKAANKQASATKTKQASAKEASQTTAETTITERKRERGDARAAAMILQRDLGLAPSGGRRRGKAAAATAEAERTKADEGKSESVPSTPTMPTGPKASRAKAAKDTTSKAPTTKGSATTVPTPTEPSTATTTDNAASAATPRAPKAAKQQKPKQQPASSTATQAFLKHANPSQGVTEELLDTAFSAFGKVTKVEIDKKKGFGYVDFAEAEGLQKAIAASPVTVAQSQVVVLERKNPLAQQAKAVAKSVETASQASPAAPATQQTGGGTQKRSRGPRSRGGRGKGKAAGEGGSAGKVETGGTSET